MPLSLVFERTAMLESDRKYVALFIDWDNLVISTAADLGGAAPDLKRIVQKAQQYGVVLLAKAYAEWQTTNDKLNVYRTGVEPVYAPTFRFETEATMRGKSLADPCMVADIVDSLHLFPMINTYVIVTGDKDMIPVVRLGQLRGKKVVVIGPDFVAGVLRDMADEFVSYRKLVDAEQPRLLADQARRPASATQMPPAIDQTQHDATVPSRAVAARPATASGGGELATPRVDPRRDRSRTRGRTPERQAVLTPVRKDSVVEAPPAQEAAAESPVAKAQANGKEGPATPEKPQAADTAAVYSAIVELLQQRAAEGKPRVRATNLKDALMQKIPGFSERRYGFSKFKDLLTAAETAGLVKVRVAGPVHWVSLPDRAEESSGESAEQPGVQETIDLPQADDEGPKMVEMVQFIQNLRQRSRWLTYTYLLTNLISHFARALPQASAEARARSTLNWLVQEGVLRIDKEPQEVEVAGAKHRVRMCHLEDTHALVASVLAEAQQTTELEASAPADSGTAGAEGERSTTTAEPALATAAVIAEATDVATKEAQSPPVAEMTPKAEDTSASQPDDEPQPQCAAVEATPPSDASPSAPQGERASATEASAVEAPVEPAEGEISAEPLAGAEPGQLAGSPSEEAEPAVDLANPPSENGETDTTPTTVGVSETATPSSELATSSRKDWAFKTLAELVKEHTGPKRARMGAAGLKVRLTKHLGEFDERAFGFSRFRDFLKAAEDQGYVRTQTVGQITWVLPPNSGQSDQADASGQDSESEPEERSLATVKGEASDDGRVD